MEILYKPWPWYVAGPVIGLTVPLLLLLGNKKLGISSSLRHICAACVPAGLPLFRYDWKKEVWNLNFSLGLVIGGFIGGVVFANPEPIGIAESTWEYLQSFGVAKQTGLMPVEIFSWGQALTTRSLILIVAGGFLVGFGTRYARGCTSGHGILGLSAMQWPSLVATVSFFAGGTLFAWIVLPYLLAL